MNLIGNGLLALLRRPDQLADPDLIPRDALTELEPAGQVLPPGTGVAVLLAAANRDPTAYPDPDRLDVTRFHQRMPAPPADRGFSCFDHPRVALIGRRP